jgi:hypothetical protein
MSGPPNNPREGRQQGLVAFLQVAFGLVVVMSLVALLAPVSARETLSAATVIALVAVPVLRVGWLAVRWLHLGDRPYAWRAFALLGVMAGGAVLAI